MKQIIATCLLVSYTAMQLTPPTFTKTIPESQFLSEGADVGNFNRDIFIQLR